MVNQFIAYLSYPLFYHKIAVCSLNALRHLMIPDRSNNFLLHLVYSLPCNDLLAWDGELTAVPKPQSKDALC